jgi:hypothetical protein
MVLQVSRPVTKTAESARRTRARRQKKNGEPKLAVDPLAAVRADQNL